MSLLTVEELTLGYGARLLFDRASLEVGARDRIGLIGANGTGKSTLLKILAGRLEPDGGRVVLQRRATLGYLPQELSEAADGTLLESVERAVPGRVQLEGRLADAQAALERAETPEEQGELGEAIAELTLELTEFEARHGRHRAQSILAGLGFPSESLERPLSSFSGGWRMRAALAGLLLQSPDVLLLDEPTNHLDLPTLAWFDGFLRSSRKALLLISHDRAFLNRQITRVLSLEPEGVRSYPGDVDAYRRARATEREQLAARAARVEAERERTLAFVERFGAKATKARAAQSRLKRLDKLEEVEVHEDRQTLRFSFPSAARSGREVVRLSELSFGFGDGGHRVYERASASLLRGQKVAVVGPNGAGKTTLLRLVAGDLVPSSGELVLGHGVEVGYYAQHQAEALEPRLTIYETLAALVPDRSQSYVRSVAGAFLFSGDDVEKRVGVLSGGERARVALAKLLLVPSNLLVLDEPTNHLDLDSSEALIGALAAYDGSVLFVSHNRGFIEAVATELWDVRDRTVVTYIGSVEQYLGELAEKASAIDGAERVEFAMGSGGARKAKRRQEADERARRAAVLGPIEREVRELEEAIARVEAEQAERERALASPEAYASFEITRPLMEAHREGKERLEALSSRWEEAQVRLDGAKASLD